MKERKQREKKRSDLMSEDPNRLNYVIFEKISFPVIKSGRSKIPLFGVLCSIFLMISRYIFAKFWYFCNSVFTF